MNYKNDPNFRVFDIPTTFHVTFNDTNNIDSFIIELTKFRIPRKMKKKIPKCDRALFIDNFKKRLIARL